MQRKQQTIAWERRWGPAAAGAAFLSVALLVVSNLASQVKGSGDAEILRSTHEHAGSVLMTGLMQAVAFALLGVPLFFLFRAVRARSERVRSQLVGIVVVAPLFLAVSSGLTIGARDEAAKQFVNGEAKSTLSAKAANEKCVSERSEKGAKSFGEEFKPTSGETPLAACQKRKSEDDEAENAIGEASLAPIESGLGLAGGLGFVAALFYSGLWAMRTGILSRFWASLGMVSGVAFLLGPLFVITLIWFIYFGLVAIDRVPGGRSPAWDAGEAVPWPTPGEKAAAELEPDPDLADPDPDSAPPALGNGSAAADPGEGRRKRKQRD